MGRATAPPSVVRREVRRDAAGSHRGHGARPDQGAWYNKPVDVEWHRERRDLRRRHLLVAHLHRPGRRQRVRQGSCTDAAGNSSNSSNLGLRYDSTPPLTTLGTPSPAPNAKGWLQLAGHGRLERLGHDLQESPRAAPTSGYSGPDTAGATLSGSCTDNAGNTSNGSVHGQVRHDIRRRRPQPRQRPRTQLAGSARP